jgi:hypothetical protein
MKFKLKNITKIIGVIAFAFLTNCSKDEFVHGNQISNTKNDVSFEQFKNETGLNQFKNNIKIERNNDNATNKNADGSYEMSDFNIDTNIIKKLVVNQKASYTFVIHPKETVSNSIFNLTMFYKNGWQTVIVKLDPTPQNLLALKNGTTKEFVGSMGRVYQSNITPSSTSRCSYIDVQTIHCTCSGSVCDQCNQCVSSVTYSLCENVKEITSEGYGGGTAPTGNTGSPAGGGTTGNNANTNENQVDIIPNFEGLGITGNNGEILTATQIAFNSFVNSLPIYQFNFVTQQTPEFKQSLLDYFASQQRSEASKLFIKQVIDRMIQNPGLNIDIIKSSKSPFFIDLDAVKDNSTPEKQKFNDVYNALIDSPKFKELFLNVFGGNQTMANVKFEIGPTISNANGQTKLTSFDPLNNTITLNPTYLQTNNKMSIAKSILHECLHAFLNYKLFNSNSGMTIPMLNNTDFNNCINQFYNGFSANQDQHNFIYNFMLPTMETILAEVKDTLVSPASNDYMLNAVTVTIPFNNSPPTPFVWANYFHNLALLGLQSCNFFQSEIGTIIIVNNNPVPSIVVNQTAMQSFLIYFNRDQYIVTP